MTMSLSPEAQAAVERIAQRRHHENRLRALRETQARAREQRAQALELARTAASAWDDHYPRHHDPDGIPATCLRVLADGGWLTTSRVALTANRGYEATRRALVRLERDGEVESRVEDGARYWRSVDSPPPRKGPSSGRVKLDEASLIEYLEQNPGCLVADVAAWFGANEESTARRLRDLAARGLAKTVREPLRKSRWYAGTARVEASPAPPWTKEEIVVFVRGNPGCTTRMVATRFGVNLGAAAKALVRLRNGGRVTSVVTWNGSVGMAEWRAVE